MCPRTILKMRTILILVTVGLLSCSGQKVLETHDSPTGDFVLQVLLGDRNDSKDKYILSFKLLDKKGKELDYHRTLASDVMKWAVTWYNDTTIILDSHDVGTYGWIVDSGRLKAMNVVPRNMEDKCIEAFKTKYGTHGIQH